jgi:superkiller protein 8
LANICLAHIVDIFSLAITDKQILSTSGASSIKVHSTTDADFPLVQSIDGAHTIGCHHIVTNGNGSRAITAGFDGEIKAWSCQDGYWTADKKVTGKYCPLFDNKGSRLIRIADLTGADAWAIALSEDGQYLAGVTQEGRINVWDLAVDGTRIRDHETKGSFGTCIDLVRSQILAAK